MTSHQLANVSLVSSSSFGFFLPVKPMDNLYLLEAIRLVKSIESNELEYIELRESTTLIDLIVLIESIKLDLIKSINIDLIESIENLMKDFQPLPGKLLNLLLFKLNN